MQQLRKVVQLPIEDYVGNFTRFASKVQNERNIRYTVPAQMAKMLRDLAERGLDKGLYGALVAFAGESLGLTPENPNVVRVIHSLLKGFQGLYQSPYFTEEVLGNLVVKYLQGLEQKVV